jgi:putative peptidoglycan lipid II flippase
VVLNVVWIGVLAGMCPFLPAEGYWRIGTVCWGILVAGVAQIFFQLPELRRVGFHLRFCFTGWRTSEHLRKVLLQMGPASFGIALAQINICVDGWLAFYGAAWAPSALEYADRIIYLPLGLFGTAFATVLLPTYSRQVASDNVKEMVETLEHALRTLLVVMAPMAIGLIVLAEPIVALIYQRGAFDTQSVCWTARAVTAYAPGLLVFSAAKTVVPIFYAFKDLKTPVYVASWCIVGNFALNLLSVLFLPEGWRHVGIAVSTCVNALVNTLILLVILKRRGIQMNLRGLCPVTLKTLLAASGMGACAYGAYHYLSAYLPDSLAVLIAIAFGGITYLPLIFLFARQTFREVLADFKFKRRKR